MQLGAKAKQMTQPVQILVKSAVLVILGLAISFAHHGTLMRVDHMTSHPYWRVALGPALESLGVVGAALALWYRWGRKRALLIGMLLTGALWTTFEFNAQTYGSLEPSLLQ